jgi:signal transduction histidine kinase/CheY-like chemotaxis protein
MALPLRYRLAFVLVGLNVISIGVLAQFSYQASRQSLEEQARATARAVAEQRQQALDRLLQSRQRRLEGFLESVESLCGERGPGRRLALETECVHVALLGFVRAETATAVELKYQGRSIARRGVWAARQVPIIPDQLAIARADDPNADFTMTAARAGFAIRARFPRHDLEPLFRDQSGLGANGLVLLVDSAGGLLTSARDTSTSVELGSAETLAACLSGQSGNAIGRDAQGRAVIIGFRPARSIGGGCVLAQLQYADVLVPINGLGRKFLYMTTAFILLGVLLSLLLSLAVAKPIARLAAVAGKMQEGRFEPPPPIRGPAEVRELQRAFSRMAAAIGDLVKREHNARVEAETASRLKDDFLATMSHELRTPLNAILGWASIAAREPANGTRFVSALRAIERNARTQARLIDDLLDVSRITSGRMRLNRAKVSLESVIDAAIETLRPAADAKEIAIVKEIAAPCVVTRDPQRQQQVVWNLLSNAVRFTPERGRVAVRLGECDGQAEVQVSDTGNGIDPEFLPHIFEPFRQADSSPTRRHGGLGLGLAIVRHLIELHGGTVAAESAGRGQGAAFTIRLPFRLETAAVSSADPIASSAAPIPLHGVRVVVVDDDSDVRDVLRIVLEDAGATVTTAASAEETRTVLGIFRPDLLIADIGMPGEDGYSLIRTIREAHTGNLDTVPAIAVTAHAQREDADKALASGFQVHMAKPVDLPHLVAIAARLVHPGGPTTDRDHIKVM